MSIDGRLNRLMPALSGRERAIIVLRNFKEGKQQDQRMAQGMSTTEVQEYNRLMRLLNVCNTELVSLIIALKLSIDLLHVRLVWLLNVTMWEIHSEELNRYLAECTTEPVTESEHRKLEQKRRKPAIPQWGVGYDVRPDTQLAAVSRERKRRNEVRKRLQQVLNTEANAKAPWWTQAGRDLPQAIRDGVKAYWGELRALEVVLDEVAQEFGGEDVLKPITRADIEDTRQQAGQIHLVIQEWSEPFELPEADDEDVRQTRDLVYKWADNRR